MYSSGLWTICCLMLLECGFIFEGLGLDFSQMEDVTLCHSRVDYLSVSLRSTNREQQLLTLESAYIN